MSDYYRDEFYKLESKYTRTQNALKDMFAMLDEGLLVRNISEDSKPDWAMNNLGLVMRLKKAMEAIDG